MPDNDFKRGAVNNLSRAKEQRNAVFSKPAQLFYAALELRFGIESRYREYLEHQAHVAEKKKRGWQIAALDKSVEDAFAGCTQEVRIALHCGGYPVSLFKYTPVTPELKSIGEKLGNFLHAPKDSDLQTEAQWTEFREMLESGLALLEYACSGNLLGVPLRQEGSSRMMFNASIDADQSDLFREMAGRQAEVRLDVSYHPPLSA